MVLQKHFEQFCEQSSTYFENLVDDLGRIQATIQKFFFKVYPVVIEDIRIFNISCT